ncbi:SMI1/KNR4 family protein [Dactylosporangium sp. NPDC049742]|uniref:SMI1/KNR4 family protein n=1 Tax=Dactylosporangium sp. NPDC049742 TaxID=3154737 RepID=UPI0034358939
MEMAEFDVLAAPVQRELALNDAEWELGLVFGVTATAEELADVERAMGVVLPDKYKAFMIRHGGGILGVAELFTVDELRTLNDKEFPDRTFVAVSAVGTGDHWGFPVTGGRCHDQVWFHFHDDGDDEVVAEDFLEFVARQGLRV